MGLCLAKKNSFSNCYKLSNLTVNIFNNIITDTRRLYAISALSKYLYFSVCSIKFRSLVEYGVETSYSCSIGPTPTEFAVPSCKSEMKLV